MNRKLALFVDELGESVPARYKVSPFFILTGCVVDKDRISEISTNLDHIKFKYWSRVNVVFHTKNIGRKDKDFTIFKNDLKKFREFINDLKFFFNKCPLYTICIIVDQKSVYNLNWKQRRVIKIAYEHLIANFIRVLVAQDKTGEFIQEASTPIQDISIYEAFFGYQSLGLPSDKLDHLEIKRRLTSLSFSTKRNMDTLTQVADLLGYGLNLSHRVKNRIVKVASLNGYERMIRKEAENKLFHTPQSMGLKKKNLYKNFQAIVNIP